MLGSLMVAMMATGLAAGPSCAGDFQSARVVSVDPIEVSSTGPDAGIESVQVLASINAAGRIDQVTTLDQTASDRIQRAIEKSSARWQFEPAQACGEAVAQEVTFDLPVLGTRFANIDTDHSPGSQWFESRAARNDDGRRSRLGLLESF